MGMSPSRGTLSTLSLWFVVCSPPTTIVNPLGTVASLRMLLVFLGGGIEESVEPCESGLFSSYINCYGKFVYCSFAEGIEKEIDVLDCYDFLEDVWNSDQVIEWRKNLIENKRNCPIYDLAFKEK